MSGFGAPMGIEHGRAVGKRLLVRLLGAEGRDATAGQQRAQLVLGGHAEHADTCLLGDGVDRARPQEARARDLDLIALGRRGSGCRPRR